MNETPDFATFHTERVWYGPPDFDREDKPLYDTIKLSPKDVLIVHDSDRRRVGHALTSYKILQHATVHAAIKTTLPDIGGEIETIVSGGKCGEKCAWTIKLGEGREITPGDMIQPRVIVLNGIDGTSSLKIIPALVRCVCTNQFWALGREVSVTKYHTAGLDYDNLLDMMEKAIDSISTIYDTVLEWVQLPAFPYEIVRDILRDVGGFSKILKDDALQDMLIENSRSSEKHTPYEIFNTLTYYGTHQAIEHSRLDGLVTTVNIMRRINGAMKQIEKQSRSLLVDLDANLYKAEAA